MAGYSGFSMSNNAVEAYENGEKPISKWSKKDILNSIDNAIENGELVLNCSKDKLRKVPVALLKELCLTCSSWHHTSNYYNRTDFYAVDLQKVELLTDESIEDRMKSKDAVEITEEIWKCAFLEWSGTRKHPKATEVVEEGIIRGEWFFRKDGSKKKVTANGFRRIERLR